MLSPRIDPDRYRAVIAIAPVTDLSALRRDAEGFSDEDLTKAFIGKGVPVAGFVTALHTVLRRTSAFPCDYRYSQQGSAPPQHAVKAAPHEVTGFAAPEGCGH